MQTLRILTSTLLLFISQIGFSQTKDQLIGFWKSCDNDNFMVVEIFEKPNGELIGELVGYNHPDGTWTERKDSNRTVVMHSFEYHGELKWKKGKIYDPHVNRTYRGVIQLMNTNLIQATGYWGVFWDDINFKRFEI